MKQITNLNLFALPEKYELVEAELPAILFAWAAEIEKSEDLFSLDGQRLEQVMRDIPKHQGFFALRAAEAKALVRWLEIFKAQKEAKILKNYNNSPRALGVKEQAMYIQGEKEICDVNQLIAQTSMLRDQFEELVEAVKQIGWTTGNITKLRVAELQDVII